MGKANTVLKGLWLFGGGQGSSPPFIWVPVPQSLLLAAPRRPVNAPRPLTEYWAGFRHPQCPLRSISVPHLCVPRQWWSSVEGDMRGTWAVGDMCLCFRASWGTCPVASQPLCTAT